MNLLPLILYSIGIIGIILSLIFIIFSIKRGGHASLSLIIAAFLLSISLMGAGSGILFLQHMKVPDDSDNIEVGDSSEQSSTKNAEASIDNLKFEYNLASSGNSIGKYAEITIDNNSDSVFNGKINLTFLDSSQKVTNTLVLPIKNLMPNSTYNPNALVSNSASNIEYSFSGNFDKNIDTSIPFTIKKITFGNNFFRFDVITDDASPQNLKNICDQFSSEYNSSLCDGFLIYFYSSNSSEKLNFNDALGDFYLDNSTQKSNLVLY